MIYTFNQDNLHIEISGGTFWELMESRLGWFSKGNRLSDFDYFFNPNVTDYEEQAIFDYVALQANDALRIISKKSKKPITTAKIIISHGGSQDGTFDISTGYHSNGERFYMDRTINLEDWIKDNDGKYEALLINSCNWPNTVRLRAKKSLVYYPKNITDLDKLARGDDYLLSIPGKKRSISVN